MAEVVVAMEKVDEVEKVRTCWYRRELRVARMLLGVVMYWAPPWSIPYYGSAVARAISAAAVVTVVLGTSVRRWR